jgi:hypothetical protein
MNSPSKKDFYKYMSSIYGKYEDTNGYKSLIETIDRASEDPYIYDELSEFVEYSEQERLAYRYALACHGKELTPEQVDRHISIVEYALDHIDL